MKLVDLKIKVNRDDLLQKKDGESKENDNIMQFSSATKTVGYHCKISTINR